MRLLGPNRTLLALGIASVSAVAALLVLGSGLRDAPQPLSFSRKIGASGFCINLTMFEQLSHFRRRLFAI